MASNPERGIYQRGNAFVVDITVKGRRAVEQCPTYAMALIRRDELRAQLRREAEALPAAASSVAHNCWSLGKALLVSSEVRWAGTRNGDKAITHAAEACQFFGKATPLDAITTEKIDIYYAHLRSKSNGPATINRKGMALSALFTDALKRGGCSRKPAFPRQVETPKRIRYLSDAEEQRIFQLLAQWDEPVVAQALTVLLDTGMRVGELMALRIGDVDLKAQIISIWENKGDLPRSVPMTSRVLSIVGDRCITSKGTVFHDLERSHLEYVWSKLRAAMDLNDDDRFVLHALRSTCATRLLQRGVSMYLVQKVLGHADIKITERYAHLADQQLVDAIQSLEPRADEKNSPGSGAA